VAGAATPDQEFIRAAMELLTDPDRLDRARSKVEAGSGELSRWDAILSAELVERVLTSSQLQVGRD
jgi:hypothetical protein